MIWNFLFMEFGELGHFYHKNSFTEVGIIFLRLKFGKNPPIKKSMLVVLSYIYVVFILTIFNLYHVFYLCIYFHIIEHWSQIYLVCSLRFMVVSCENSLRILSPHMELQCHLSPCQVVSLVSYAPKARTRNFKNGVYFP